MNNTIENDFLKVTIKSKGAELSNIYNKKTKLEYMWSGDAAIWGKTSPILFPIVGTLKNDTYFYNDKSYSLSRHGFARDHEFNVEAAEKSSITFLFTSSDASLMKYPFQFELRVTYTLSNDTLSVGYSVTNPGKEVLYFSVGGHPAFKVPLIEGTQYEDYYLQFNKNEALTRWPISKDGLIEQTAQPVPLNNNKLELTRTLFQNDALVFKKLNSNAVSLKTDKSKHGLDFEFTGFPYLGIWAAKNGDFVCIEPWLGVADSVNHNQQLIEKEGILKLDAGKVFTKAWSVRFY